MKYTDKEKWLIHDANDGNHLIKCGDTEVALVYGSGHSKERAGNAFLMAHSPKMYKALKRVQDNYSLLPPDTVRLIEDALEGMPK